MRSDSPICDRVAPLRSRTHLVKGGVRRLIYLGFAIAFVACGAATPAASPAPVAQATAAPTVAPSASPEPTATPAPATPTPTATPNWTAVPDPAQEPAALAKQLVMVEAALRDPNVTGPQLAYMGHFQQLIYGTLQDNPDWKDTALAALPEKTRAAVAGSLEAGRQLRTMNGPVPSRLPDWKIVEPAPIDDLLTYYKEAEKVSGVSWQYLAAIHLVETRMGRIRGLSSAGAQGPMQFMPATWAAYGKGDVNSDHDAILGAANYLKVSGAPGNMQKALFAYNHAQAYVNALVLYAEVMRNDPMAYRGYWGWQVYYPTKDGTVLLAAGWKKE
jgi:hypothetical protein